MADEPLRTSELLKEFLAESFKLNEAYGAAKIDFQKQRIAFYDKLVVLSAGTVTLSFTAFGTFHQNHATVRNKLLIWAYCLLTFTVIASLIANWAAISFQVLLLHAEVFMKSEANYEKTRLYMERAGVNVPSLPARGVAATSSIKHERKAGITHRVSEWVGLSGQAAFAVAYILIILFIAANPPS